MKPRKVVGRWIALTLASVCIVMGVLLIGAFAYYVPLIDDRNNTVSSLNVLVSQLADNCTNLQSEIDSLNLNLTNLQNQLTSANFTINSLSSDVAELQEKLDTIRNWSASTQYTVMSNLSDWVDKTVILEGKFDLILFPIFEHSPYYGQLQSNNLTIPVSYQYINNSTFESFWKEVTNGTQLVRIFGVVEKGEITYTSDMFPPEVVYYVQAMAAEPL